MPAARPAPRAPALAAPVALAFVLAACGGGTGDEPTAGDTGGTGDTGETEVVLPFATESHAAIDFLGRVVPDLPLTTSAGEPTTLFDGRDGRVLVVCFTQVDCPIAQRYGPKLARLHEQFRQRGVDFVGIDASPQDSGDEIVEQAERLKLEFPFLKDGRQELLLALDVKTSTEVLVLDRERRLRYRGAVDDGLDVGGVRSRVEHDYLHDALVAVLDGESPEILATDAPGCIITRLDRDQAFPDLPDPVTYHEHVAPILEETCVPCHREGQVAPFALASYDDARGWSGMMRFVIEEGIMPPWYVSSHFDGEFAGQRSLGAREEAVLMRWIESGMAPGDPALGPEPKVWPEGWVLEDIDMVLEADLKVNWRPRDFFTPMPPEGHFIPAESALDYVDFASSHVFEEERWVTGVELLPGAPTVVHHIGAFILDAGLIERAKSGQRRERGADEGPDELSEVVGAGYFAFYGPGAAPREYPEGYAKRIPKGSMIRFQVHYTADGSEHHDRPSMALRFAKEPPRYEVITASASNEDFVLAPDEPHLEVRAARTFPVDVELIGLHPHMHYRGRQFRFMLRYPDGLLRALLNVDFRFDWQATYTPTTPIFVPAGSTLLCSGIMDNSADNQWNPDPSVEVRFGQQSWDEMFFGYFDYAVALANLQGARN